MNTVDTRINLTVEDPLVFKDRKLRRTEMKRTETLKSQASSFNVNQKKIDLYIAQFRSKLDNEDIAQIKKEIPAMAINAKRSYTELLFNIKRRADHKDSKGHLD